MEFNMAYRDSEHDVVAQTVPKLLPPPRGSININVDVGCFTKGKT